MKEGFVKTRCCSGTVGNVWNSFYESVNYLEGDRVTCHCNLHSKLPIWLNIFKFITVNMLKPYNEESSSCSKSCWAYQACTQKLIDS
jgi:hypothetical protein